MILIWLVMVFYFTVPLFVIFAWHRNLLKKYWRLLLLVQLVILAIWGVGDTFAARHQIWQISFDPFSGTSILGTQVGSLVWFIFVTFILSAITIAMWQAKKEGRHFRQYFLARGNIWHFLVLMVLTTFLVFLAAYFLPQRQL